MNEIGIFEAITKINLWAEKSLKKMENVERSFI